MSRDSVAISKSVRTGNTAMRGPLQAVQFESQSAQRHVERTGVLGLGQMYEKGLWSTDDLKTFMDRLFASPPMRLSVGARCSAILTLLGRDLINRQSMQRAFNIGVKHYDLGNSLFRCMLDESMTYTSGYWKNANNLNDAQRAKLDLICQKLNLQAKQHVLDIGCGWGNFAHHAASEYGARVTGLTISKEQAAFARARCEHLDVEILLKDYRSLNRRFDHIVSIEMIEAVGRKNIPTYFEVIDRCLSDDGLCVIQAISGDTFSSNSDPRLDQFMLWLVKYIFPDGYLPRRTELLPPAHTRLQVEDWQRFYGDYNKTLLAWADRLNDGWPQIAMHYDDHFRRRWNFYLHGCAAAFRARLVDVYQIVYSRGDIVARHQPIR